jgi:hypothetical protein
MTNLTQEEFAAHLNTKFRVFHSESETEVELVEVSEINRRSGQERFSLVFRGPLKSFVPQGNYRWEHEAMGEFPLFIVPIRQDKKGFYYEAIFNRLTGQAATS